MGLLIFVAEGLAYFQHILFESDLEFM